MSSDNPDATDTERSLSRWILCAGVIKCFTGNRCSWISSSQIEFIGKPNDTCVTHARITTNTTDTQQTFKLLKQEKNVLNASNDDACGFLQQVKAINYFIVQFK